MQNNHRFSLIRCFRIYHCGKTGDSKGKAVATSINWC